MLTRGGTVKLQVHSTFDMLDFVQLVSDRMAHLGGLDEDAVHGSALPSASPSSTRSVGNAKTSRS